jgi:hypothetical protein
MAELLLLLLLSVFLWLFNGALPEWLRRRQLEVPQDVEPPERPVVVYVPRPQMPRPQTPPAVVPRRTPSPTVLPLVATRQRPPVQLGSRQEVRRGLVLMTILGPCRALEPPEPQR